MVYKYRHTWTDANRWEWTLFIFTWHASQEPYPGTVQFVPLPEKSVLSDSFSFTAEIGDIPAGIVSGSAKITFNLDALTGSTALEQLREALLKPIYYNAQPLTDTGAYFQPEGKVFQIPVHNLFYINVDKQDGNGAQGFASYCQKPTPNNELTISSLPLTPYTIELYDAFRVIGECIKPDLWQAALAPTEAQEVRTSFVNGYYVRSSSEGRIPAYTLLPNGAYFKVQKFDTLRDKIKTLYESILRVFSHNLGATVNIPSFFRNITLYEAKQFSGIPGTVTGDDLFYIAEIWAQVAENGQRFYKRIGGVHYDKQAGWPAFASFHDVLKNLAENCGELWSVNVSFEQFITVTAQKMFNGALIGHQIDRDTVLNDSDVKFSINAGNGVRKCTVTVQGLTGELNIKESKALAPSGTDNDTGKDLKIIFHNLPVISGKDGNTGVGLIDQVYMHPGTLLYRFSGQVQYSRPSGRVIVNDGVDSYTFAPAEFSSIPFTAEQIAEQQNSCLPFALANLYVNALSRPGQFTVELNTLPRYALPVHVGKQASIYLESFSTFLRDYLGEEGLASAVLLKTEIDPIEGKATCKYIYRGA